MENSRSSHYRALLRLGLPIVAGQLGIMAFSIADTIMVGQHSQLELSAVGLTNQIFNMAIVACIGFSYGLTPLVGALFGQGKSGDIGRLLRNAILANLVIAVFFSALLFVFYLNIHRMGQPEELIPVARPYFLTLLYSLFPLMIFNAFRQCVEGIQDTRTCMWILLVGNAVHIVSNYAFIYGFWIIPEMGLTGAGISTLLTRVGMCIFFVYWFFCRPRYAPFREGFRLACLNRVDFKRLNALGWPIATQMFLETASFSFCAVMIGWMGATALATNQIIYAVSGVFFMMYIGMGAAITVRISYFRGQGDLEAARRSALCGFHLIMFIALGCILLVWLCKDFIAPLFTDDPEIARGIPVLLLPLFLYQFSDGLQIAFASALRGLSDVKILISYSFVCYLVISLPISYLFAFVFDWGLAGIWYSFTVSLTIAGVLYYLRFMRQLKHRIVPPSKAS